MTLPRAGQTFTRYRIIEQMRAGGMGVVFRAQDTELGRGVALKFLPLEFSSDPRAVARFRLEAKAASALNHPNVCTIFDIGEHEGLHFIAMELLEGQALDHRIGARALSIGTALDLALQMAEGLAAAHRKGIVHRDLKPANVFVTTEGRAKILDFGIAKRTPLPEAPPATRTLEPRLTRTGVAIGTPAYMSPEQATGQELDARTDLFSFGAVLYEMVTGAPCFRGATAAELFDAILNKAPAPARSLNPQVPPELEQILRKALEKDRRLRYQSAAELRADLLRLKHARESMPTTELGGIRPEVGWGMVARNFLRRRPVAAASAVIVLSVLLALGLVRTLSRRAESEAAKSPVAGPISRPVVAVLPFDNGSPDPADAYFAQGIHQDVIAQLGMIPGTR